MYDEIHEIVDTNQGKAILVNSGYGYTEPIKYYNLALIPKGLSAFDGLEYVNLTDYKPNEDGTKIRLWGYIKGDFGRNLPIVDLEMPRLFEKKPIKVPKNCSYRDGRFINHKTGKVRYCHAL